MKPLMQLLMGGAIAFLSSNPGAAEQCGPELAERVAIPDSQWAVVTYAFRCSVMDPGELRIIAEDHRSGESTTILSLNGESDSHVEYLGSQKVRITLPNLVAIRLQKFAFGSYTVTYQYLPVDDPEARTNFEHWTKDPTDPVAKKWYEENLRDKIQPGVPHSK